LRGGGEKRRRRKGNKRNLCKIVDRKLYVSEYFPALPHYLYRKNAREKVKCFNFKGEVLKIGLLSLGNRGENLRSAVLQRKREHYFEN
jgi:hypothetical protein